jgi:hypothetical protein
MILKGYTQKKLVTEINARGLKISENTFSSKMSLKSQFDCELVDIICDILGIVVPAEKADIFLASPSHFWDVNN